MGIDAGAGSRCVPRIVQPSARATYVGLHTGLELQVMPSRWRGLGLLASGDRGLLWAVKRRGAQHGYNPFDARSSAREFRLGLQWHSR